MYWLKNHKWLVIAAIIIAGPGLVLATTLPNLSALTGAGTASTDLVIIADIDAVADKKQTIAEHAIAIAANFADNAITGSDVTAATDSAEGVVELATDAETATGTATDRVTTPANITSLAHITISSTDILSNKTLIDDSNVVHAEEVFVRVRNTSGGTLTAGTAVYASGYNVGQDLVEVDKADADDPAKMPALGLIEADISNNASGHVTLSGDVADFNTSTFTVLDELYVSTTAGVLTATRPTAAGTEVQKIAIVTRDHGSFGLVEVFGAGRANDIPNTFATDFDLNADLTASATAEIDMALTDSTAGEGIVLPQHATVCPASTVAGQICLEVDADILHISDGTALRPYLPAGAFSSDILVGVTGATTIQTNAVDSAEITSGAVDEDHLAATLTFDDGDLLDFGTFVTSNSEGIMMPAHATDCSTATAEAQLCWEEDANAFFVGDGSAALRISPGGVQTLWLPADEWKPATTNGATALAQTETTALRPDIIHLGFAAAADDFAQMAVAFSPAWDLGTVTFQVYWAHSGGSTFNVDWALECVAVTNDGTIDVVYGTPVVVEDVGGTTEDLYITPESGAVTCGGTPADGKITFFQIYRDTSGDDLDVDADLIGVKILFTTDSAL